MTDYTYLISFYFLLFAIILLIKKIRHLQIIINGIWFSEDGSVSESAIHNLLQLAEMINKSAYKKNYKIFFWTDSEKLKPTIKAQLENKRIQIKDYRLLSPKDTSSLKVTEWINKLVILGSERKDKLLFTMASDMLRLYLVLKELPTKHPRSVVCYFDCNDTILKTIPSPKKLKKLNGVSFNFVPMECLPISNQLNNKASFFLNNDFIMTFKKNNQKLFNKIFEAYCNNLIHLDKLLDGMINAYINTVSLVEELDVNTKLTIMFATTHTINILSQYGNKVATTYLSEFRDNYVEILPLENILDSNTFCDFERHEENGMTWLGDAKFLDNSKNKNCELWYKLLKDKNQLTIECIQNQIL